MPGPLCFWGQAVLRRLELALGRDAISLAHRGEALTLAGVLAGAGGLGALAFAGVRGHAMPVSGLCIGRDGHASQEQGGSSCSDGGARLGSNLHDNSSESDLAKGASAQGPHAWPTSLHPVDSYVRDLLCYTADQTIIL
jgi:hypothetical protein